MGRTFIRAPSENRMPSLSPLVWPSARALSHALWRGRSVRVQLLIVFIVIDVIAGLVAGAVTILQARASTRVEIAASMELAELAVAYKGRGVLAFCTARPVDGGAGAVYVLLRR